ncbi:MAG TPA: hypothetical protein VIF88_12460 [Methylocystis sp.]|jgi:hypothetical protein
MTKGRHRGEVSHRARDVENSKRPEREKLMRTAKNKKADADMTDKEIRRELDTCWEEWRKWLADAEPGKWNLFSAEARKNYFFETVRKAMKDERKYSAQTIESIASRFWSEALSRLAPHEWKAER